MSSAPRTTIWKADPHTLAKHEILRHYMGRWYAILLPKNERLLYIDGFCGPGEYEGGEDGSPVIVLNLVKGIDGVKNAQKLSFLFIDEKENRVNHLKGKVEEIDCPDNFNVVYEVGEFHNVLKKVLDIYDSRGSSLPPSFSFIDPFGYSDIPFQVLERLFTHEKSELLITFMSNSVNRFLGVTPEPIADLFGVEDVSEIINDPKYSKYKNREKSIVLAYVDKLRTLPGAKYVLPFQMLNKDDQSVYYLVFVTKHSLGYKKMKEAMWKVSRAGSFRFSDAHYQKESLFEIDDSLHAQMMFEDLARQFANRRINVETIKNYVELNTIYLDTHMRSALRYGEEAEVLEVEERKENGKSRRRDTFPSDAVVVFK